MDPSALAHERQQVQLGLRAPAHTDHHDPAAGGQRVQVAGEVGTANELEHDVERALVVEAVGGNGGVGAGFKAELNLLALMGKRGRIHGSTLRPRPMEEKALAARRVERRVLPLVERGEIEVPVAETFPLDRAAEAYERFAAGGKVGKIVLLVD